jgi:hypothetical protein
MTPGNMRANGVRSIAVSCWQCHHRTILSADPWPDHLCADIRTTHGVHPLRNHRCRRPAESAGAAGARKLAHYAAQRPTMRPKIGSANGDATGSQ